MKKVSSMEELKDQAFVKQLVSNDRISRDKASKTFLNWLCHNHQVEQAVFRKLWKALFYSMWMTDKLSIQEQLSERLANVINKTISENHNGVIGYLTAFWQTISLEWDGIDCYRMDKYYLLLRKMIFHTFRYMEIHDWNDKAIELANILYESVLNIKNTTAPDGLRIFVCQIWLEEGCKVVDKVPTRVTRIILKPLFEFISRCNKKHISTKADQELYNTIIQSKNHLDMKTISDIYFEYGSNSEVSSHQRRLFYYHHEQLNDIVHQ